MPKYLRLYLDHSKVGCGWRSYLVLKEGRIHARVICTETAESFSVSKADLSHGRELALKPSRLAKRLRTVALTYGLQDSGWVKDACAQLRLVKAASGGQ